MRVSPFKPERERCPLHTHILSHTMPSNTAEYQREYRKANAKRRKEITVGMPTEQYREFLAFAKRNKLSLSALMREATALQLRGSQLKSRNVESELKELRFLISNIANNVNQMARHSNTVKHVADDNAVFQRLSELDQLIVDFTDTRLRSAP